MATRRRRVGRIGPRIVRAAALVVGGAVVAVVGVGLVATPIAGAAARSMAEPPGMSVPAVPATTSPADIPSDSTEVTIAMTENDGDNLIAYAPSGVSAPGVADSPAVLFEPTVPGSTWRVYTSGSCGGGGGWVLASTGQVDPVATPVTGSLPTTLCVAGGNTTVDGTLTAVYNSAGDLRTVNTLPLEEYVADTVPGESPSSWGTLGGPGPQGRDWGFQELEAQAVAVRSYVLADPDGYGGYADTCDLGCQNYRGTEYVTATSIAAADATAGEVMYMPDGSIATTEYSSSTGGYTSSAAQGSPFTPVVDAGDAVCTTAVCNPNHSWTATVPYSAIESAWPQIGTFEEIANVVGDGLEGPGETFSRVDTLTVVGTSGSVGVTGATFAVTLGLKSDFFKVTSSAGGTVHLTGHGYGHGIGMGQYGAIGYALGIDTGAHNWTYQQILAHYYAPASLGTLPGTPASGAVGYWMATTGGGIFSFGSAQFYGSMGGIPLNKPVVGMAAAPTGKGYWEVASDGGIFSFGSAQFYGSMGGIPLNKPVVGMAAAPTGKGYWEVASDGGIFNFGDAVFRGSASGTSAGAGAVAVLPTANDEGYGIVNAHGTVSVFGNAPDYGDLTTAVPTYGGTIVGAAQA